MAEKQAGGLSLRIGLTLSELQSDFLQAEQTVRQGIAALNRQQNIVRLRMETDVAGLDSFADKAKIIEVREQALSQLLEMQKDRLTLATKAFQEYTSGKNVNATESKKLETAMERERLAVARLESELKNLSSQKVSLDTSNLQSNIDKITAKIGNIRIKAEIDTAKLQGSDKIFEMQKIQVAALTKELELQRQKLIQLRAAMYQSAKTNGSGSVQTLNIKSNVLRQIQEINQLEIKLKELSNTNVNLQIRADAIRQVEQTINENIARINARIENIRVKTEIDTSKISAAVSEFDKAKVHVQGLTQELNLQNQKLFELKKALGTSISTNGLNNVKTINLQTDIQRQIQEIDRLKAKLDELNKITPPKTNNLLSGYLNIKGDITGKLNSITTAFSNLQGATSSADSAITATLGVIGAIPHPVGKAVAALASLPIIFKGTENSIVDLLKASASAGDSVYVMSRGFQMSVADTGKFTAMCKTAGVEVNDLASTIKRTQQQIIRGGDNAKAEQWLKRYGESAFDASGHLKNMNDMTLTLSRALKRAQAEGNGMAFILGTMRSASADAITAIEDAEGVYQQAAGLVKNGLANPVLAHEVQGNINAMNLQASFMKASFESALLPVANEIIPRMTDRMGKFTTLIKDNKDVILDLGRDLADVWGSIEKTVDKVTDGLSVLTKLRRDNTVVRVLSTEDIVKKYKNNSAIQHAEDLLKAEIDNGDYSAEDRIKLSSRSDLRQKELRRAQEEMKDVIRARREEFAEQYKSILEKYKDDKDIKTMTDLLNKLTAEEKELIQNDPSPFFGSLQEKVAALNLELKKLRETAEAVNNESKNFKSVAVDLSPIGQERQALEQNDELLETFRKARKYRENAQAIIDKMGMSDYQQKGYDLQSWLQEQLPREEEQSQEKYLAVMEEYKARSLQIEQERAAKLKEIRESVTSADKTALEQKLESIEKERQAWLKAGMDEAESVELAQKRIDAAYREAEQRAQEHWRNAAGIQYEMTHTAFEKELRDIELWKDAQQEKADTAEEVAGIIAESAAKEAQAFEREVDRIKGLTQSLEDEIFEMENSQYEADKRRALQKAQKALDEGVDAAIVQRYLSDKFGQLNKRAAESRKNGGDYTKSPTNDGMQRGGNGIQVISGDQIIDDGLIQSRQTEIGLLVDENQIRAQLSANLSDQARALITANQALRNYSAAQKVSPPAENSPSGFQIIEGDKVVSMPEISTAPIQEFNSALQQTSAQINQVGFSQVSTEPLQNFSANIEQLSSKMQKFNPLESIISAGNIFSEKLKQMEQNLPAEYFRNIADGALGVSEMQMRLTDSTMKLIDAQENLRNALSNLPSKEMQTNLPTNGLRQLSASTQDFVNAQEAILSRQTRELEHLPPPQKQNKGLNFGFDMDTAGTVLGLGALLAGIGGAPITAPIAAGITALSALGGLAKGIYDNSTAPTAPNATLENMPDLTSLITPLTSIDGNVQSVLQDLQSRQETTISFETIVTPLNNIENIIQNILSAMGNSKQPDVTVSPDIKIDLGGAYVFDEKMKSTLVDDITDKIVSAITEAVKSATGNRSYGYSA